VCYPWRPFLRTATLGVVGSRHQGRRVAGQSDPRHGGPHNGSRPTEHPLRRLVGTIEAIYLDDHTGQPEWALVNTGLFGTESSFVPLAQATPTGEERVAEEVRKEQIDLDEDTTGGRRERRRRR
jgi:hypothetical protein